MRKLIILILAVIFFLLQQVVLTTCLITTSLGSPQIFPFSNLRSYFDHQARNGPGSEKDAVVPEIATVVDTPLFRRPTNFGDIQVKSVSSPTKDQPPTNHKPDISPSLEPPSASAAASPVVKFHPPIPEQVLKAPDSAPPILYGSITDRDKTNDNYQIPQVTPGVVSQIPLGNVGEKKYKLFGGFVPLVPSQALLSPPTASEQKTVVPNLATVPSQDVGSPTDSFKYPEKHVNQKEQDDLEAPKQVSPIKILKSPNNLYPKKWQPEKEKAKPIVRKNTSKTDVRNLSNLNTDSDSKQPRKDREQVTEHQKAPATLQTASSFQKTDLAFYPTQAKPKVPGFDEQVETKLKAFLPDFVTTGSSAYQIHASMLRSFPHDMLINTPVARPVGCTAPNKRELSRLQQHVLIHGNFLLAHDASSSS
jgi:hypothetical protein